LETTSPGTILFNEIGYLPIGLQGKLLALLQINSHAVDGNDRIKMTAYRVLSTSSQNLRELIDASRFREDLYYELGAMELSLPPLRERLEDIPLISIHIIEDLQNKLNKNGPLEISRDFVTAIKGYSWPGNITELSNVLRVIISDVTNGQVLSSAFLPQKILSQSAGDVLSSSFALGELSVDEIYSLINQPGKTLHLPDAYSNPGLETKPLETGDNELRFCFYETGQYWKFCHPEKPVRLKKIKGYEFIHFLLQYPNKDFRPFVVYHLGKCEPGSGSVPEKYTDLTERDNPDPTYEKLNKVNEREIENAIKHLEAKLSDQDFENPQEACEIQDQIKYLKNRGKRKFERDPRSSHEKSRSNITRAISRALKEISEHAPYLEQYLNASTIRTGDHMCYRPVPDNEPTWILDRE
jgi:signal recognition particle subunit SEC65